MTGNEIDSVYDSYLIEAYQKSSKDGSAPNEKELENFKKDLMKWAVTN